MTVDYALQSLWTFVQCVCLSEHPDLLSESCLLLLVLELSLGWDVHAWDFWLPRNGLLCYVVKSDSQTLLQLWWCWEWVRLRGWHASVGPVGSIISFLDLRYRKPWGFWFFAASYWEAGSLCSEHRGSAVVVMIWRWWKYIGHLRFYQKSAKCSVLYYIWQSQQLDEVGLVIIHIFFRCGNWPQSS